MNNNIQREISSQLNLLVEEVKVNHNKELLTKKDVMQMLQVSLSTVNRWMRSGTLKAFGIESRVYFKRIDVETMLTPIN